MRDVIVIGGGVAGLVAARECAHIGLSVTVLEATDAVGGAVAHHEVAGLTLDSGAESFAVRRGSVAQFVADLGLSDEVVAPNPAGAWLHLPALGTSGGTRGGPGGRPGGELAGGSVSVPLPKAGVLGIPGSPLATDVRRVLGGGGAWRAYLDRLIPVLKIGREHSLGELVRKRMGRRVLERLVEPVASGVYSASALDLEVDVVAPGLNGALTTTGSLSGAVLALRAAAPAGSAVGGLRGGMSRLVDALVADLEHFGVEIVTGSRVQGLAAGRSDDEPVWTVTLGEVAPATDGEGPDTSTTDGPVISSSATDTSATDGPVPSSPVTDGLATDGLATDGLATDGPVASSPATDSPMLVNSPLESRFVIVATPGAQALNFLASLGPELAALTELDWPEPTVVELATFVLDAPALDVHPRGTGVLVAASTPGVTAKALTHVSAKWAWVAEAAGEGRHVVRLSYGRDGESSLTDALDDEEFQALAVQDASLLLGVELDPSTVVGFARTEWRDALSPATIGARERVHSVRGVVATVPGLELTGAWLAGTGLASVIPDAVATAGRIRHLALGL